MSNTVTRLLAWPRGGNSPAEVALAVGLGIAAGFTTGWNLIVLAIIVTAVAFRVHLRSFVAAFCGGTALGWLLMPVSVAVGRYLLDRSAFGSLTASLGDQYWVVLMELDRYAVTGGLAHGLTFGGALASAAWKLTRDTHGRFQDVASNDFPRGRRTSHRLHHALAAWLNIEAVSDTSHEVEPAWNTPLRANWKMALPVSLVLGVVILGFVVPGIIERKVLDELSRFNNAPVTASSVDVSLHDREVQLHDVRFADPVNPDLERLRIGRAKVRLHSPAGALRGRWHLEDVMLDDIRVEQAVSLIDANSPAPSETHDDQVEPQLETNSTGTVELPLVRYAPHIAELVRQMSQVETTAAICLRMAELETFPEDEQASWWDRRVALREQRSRLGSNEPRMIVEQLWVKHLPAAWRLGPDASMRLSRFASQTSPAAEPATLSINAPTVSMQLEAALRCERPRQMHDVQCRFTDLRLAELIGPVTNEDRLTAYGGEVTLEIEGRVLGDTIDLYAKAEATHPRLRVLGTEPWCGISPALWNQGFAEFDSFESQFRLLGTWDRPVLRIDGHQLQRQLKLQLVSYGIEAPEGPQPAPAVAEEVAPRMAEAAEATPAETLPEEVSTAEPFAETPDVAQSQVPGDEAWPANDTAGGDYALDDSITGGIPLEPQGEDEGTYTDPWYDDHSINPLLGSTPPVDAVAPEETLPLQPEEATPPGYEQPQVTQEVAPPAVEEDAYAVNGIVNPLRPAGSTPQDTTPALNEESDTSYRDPFDIYDYGQNETVGESQITLPEAVVENGPGPINFEQGYDQSRVPQYDPIVPQHAPAVAEVARSTAESNDEDEPRRRGRIARWSRSVTTTVRNLWPGGDDADEVASTEGPVEEIATSAAPTTDPLEDDPVLQARRDNEVESNRPWYRRLW